MAAVAASWPPCPPGHAGASSLDSLPPGFLFLAPALLPAVRSGVPGAAGASKGARMSMASQRGTGAPTTRLCTPVPCTAAPAVSRSLRGRGLPGAAWAQHPVAVAVAGRRRGGWLRFGAPSCARTHKQVPTEGKRRVPAAAGTPPQQQRPGRARPTPVSAGCTPDRREWNGGHQQGGGVRPQAEGQLPADPRALPLPPSWCCGVTAGGHCWPGGTPAAWGCPGMGCCSPGARLGLGGRRGGGRGFPGSQRWPRRSPGGRWGRAGAGVSLGFHRLQKLVQSESRGVSC